MPRPSVFAFLLAVHGFGQVVVDVLEWIDPGPTGLLLILVAMLLLIGLVVEGLAAMIIFVPVFMPLIPAFGLNELHFALIVMITLLIGTCTPPRRITALHRRCRGRHADTRGRGVAVRHRDVIGRCPHCSLSAAGHLGAGLGDGDLSGHSRHFVNVDGRQVHYRRAGNGPPVVLLHACPKSSLEQAPLLDRLGGQVLCSRLRHARPR